MTDTPPRASRTNPGGRDPRPKNMLQSQTAHPVTRSTCGSSRVQGAQNNNILPTPAHTHTSPNAIDILELWCGDWGEGQIGSCIGATTNIHQARAVGAKQNMYTKQKQTIVLFIYIDFIVLLRSPFPFQLKMT